MFLVAVSTCSISATFVKLETSFMCFAVHVMKNDKHETEMSEAVYIARKTNSLSSIVPLAMIWKCLRREGFVNVETDLHPRNFLPCATLPMFVSADLVHAYCS